MNRVSRLSEAQHQAGWSAGIGWIVLKDLAFGESTPELRYRNAVSLPLVLGMATLLEVPIARHGLNPERVHASDLVHERPIPCLHPLRRGDADEAQGARQGQAAGGH